MPIPIRSLLALTDPQCDAGLRELIAAKYSEPEHLETVRTFEDRVQSVRKSPHHGETWNANALADYLDGQLSEKEQKAWEARLETSDSLLAELLDVYFIINRTLISPAQTPWKCRRRIYAIDAPPTVKGEVEKPKVMAKTVEKIVEITPQPQPIPVLPMPIEQKPRVQDSLNEWKTDRSNRLKYVAALSVLLALGSLVWNNRDELRSYWNSESQTVGEDVVEPEVPAFAQDSYDSFLYTQMEPPETVIKKADHTAPRTRNYGDIQSATFLNEKN